MSDAPASPLTLDQAARDLLESELAALLVSVGPHAQGRWRELRAAVAAGGIPAAQLDALEQLLVMGIETGRFERAQGRAADTLARGLYARTPGGRARAQQAAAVNTALEALAGTVLESVRFAPDGPTGCRVTLETGRGEVSLRIDRQGIRLDSVGVGG